MSARKPSGEWASDVYDLLVDIKNESMDFSKEFRKGKLPKTRMVDLAASFLNAAYLFLEVIDDSHCQAALDPILGALKHVERSKLYAADIKGAWK